MADSSSQTDPWPGTLLQMQQELLQRWLKQSSGPADVSGMFDWWLKRAATAEGGAPPFMREFSNAWEQYLGLGRALAQSDANAADPAGRARSFAAIMNTWFEELGARFGPLPNFRSPPDPQQWWQTLMLGLGSSAPGLGSTASPPEFAALGLTRERQEAWQRFTRLLADYQEVQAKLARQWIHIGAETTKKFSACLSAAEAGTSARSMGSIKAIYDLWIECAEEVYGSVAHSPEYGQLIADLANSSNAVRAEQQRELESWAKQFDVPTRAEVNSLHRQVKLLRAQLRAQAPASPKQSKKRAMRRRSRIAK